MLSGVLFALAAGLIWGTVFITPLLLPQYPGTLLAFGRYLAFGLIALPLAWQARRLLRLLDREDWVEALKLSLVGNILYYSALASAIQLADAPLPTMVIGTLPVVIAIVSNFSERTVPWSRLAPTLMVLTAGLALVNQSELQRAMQLQGDPWRYAAGAGFAILATACWTWYPVRNARWLRARPALAASTWATAQGLATLPLALAGMILATAYYRLVVPNPLDLPLGPEPQRFILWMLAMGLLASWLGTLLWNEAAKRLPTSLSGQLIVFETLSALGYAWLLRRALPDMVTLAGVAMLLIGVILGVRVFSSPAAKAA
ncbi:MAG TPA: DMT family transporter [Lautropia sp.]|jgi:drug/metabolite transporter (DMT)-like permease|nr:DMT family transporter [Lautropia sp.]